MCSRADYPPFDFAGAARAHAAVMGEANRPLPDTATDAREDAVCPLHGPNLYACPDGCPVGAAFPDHPGAELTGGTIPAHVPGAYPSLSCCGGEVALEWPRPGQPHDYGQPCRCPECDGPGCSEGEPLIPPGPGWVGSGPNYDDRSDAAFVAVRLDENRGPGDTRAFLFLYAEPHDGSERREVGAELTVDDLAHLIFRAASIAEAAALEDERHFAAEAFARVRDHITRVVEPATDPNP